MTWTLIFQVGFLIVLAMVVTVFFVGVYAAIRDAKHKNALEMEMAKRGHRVEPGAVIVNTGTEKDMAERADAAIRQARGDRNL